MQSELWDTSRIFETCEDDSIILAYQGARYLILMPLMLSVTAVFAIWVGSEHQTPAGRKSVHVL